MLASGVGGHGVGFMVQGEFGAGAGLVAGEVVGCWISGFGV